MKASSLDSSLDGGLLVVRLQGYFDRSAGEGLIKEVEGRLTTGFDRCLLDFSLVSIINSPGITILLEFAENLRFERKIPLGCFGIAEMYHEIFEAVGLSALMKVFPTEAAARESL